MSDPVYRRGAARLSDPATLPCLDGGSAIYYEGSISKCGDNADWDWGLYKDEKGEWVLMEADGPGCIFNFTQHRYPTSEVPVFRFYFDGSTDPQFTVTPAEFGEKAPFIRPLADKFVGPEDGGRGPIWVVRSFVPMAFRSHCKVTSSLRLEGCDKALGQGGWGHITYQLYDSPKGLETFHRDMDTAALAHLYERPLTLPADCPSTVQGRELCPHQTLVALDAQKRGTITGVDCTVEAFAPELLQQLWIDIFYDGQTQPAVEAPFGTFFGCEYGRTPAVLQTALLTANFAGETGVFSNRFPMPFWEKARVVVENRGERTVRFATLSVALNTTLTYAPERTGYFSSSVYYPETANTPGQNSVIATVSGTGHMVYGVISGRDIQCGCEGDVRVFIDGVASPAVESDGTESWGSYGWGFVCPPQCNPFSAYNGVWGINDTWSELRLTTGDAYPFRSELRFELEHGCENNGGGFHSGQIFLYRRPDATETLLAEITPADAGYRTDGVKEPVHNRFENGIHEHYRNFSCVRHMTFSEWTISLPEHTGGLVLKRVSMQDAGPQRAAVYVDGVRVVERDWLFADSNPIYSLLEDSFFVPADYTAGKSAVTIRIIPQNDRWTECRYRVCAKIK